MRRNSPTADTPGEGSPWSTESADRFLEQSRWLADWQWRRGDAYERKASQLVGFAAVVIALLPTLIDPISKIENVGARDRAQTSLVIVTLLLVMSICCGLLALRRRRVAGFKFDRISSHWVRYTERGKVPGQVSADFVDVLLRPLADSEPVLKSLADDAQSRGKWFQHSCTLLGLSAVVLAVLLLQLLEGRG